MGKRIYNNRLLGKLKEQKRTQADLAKELKLNTSTVSLVLHGRWNLEDEEKEGFAKALKCKVSDIF
jgi:transcriptional regulator with XRE-family HTH domain